MSCRHLGTALKDSFIIAHSFSLVKSSEALFGKNFILFRGAEQTRKKNSSINFHQSEIRLVAGGEIVFHPVFFRIQREIYGAVQMSENNFVHAALFKHLREQTVVAAQIEGRVMNERYRLIPLFSERLRAGEREAEALRFAAIEFFVALGIVGASGTRPPAGTADNKIPDSNRVRLKKDERFVGRPVPEPRDAVPPIIVIAADKDLFPGQRGERVQVGHRAVHFHRPADVARNEHDVFFRHFFPPIRFYFFEMSFPVSPENIHGFGGIRRKVQIAYRINIHGNIIADSLRKGKDFISLKKFPPFIFKKGRGYGHFFNFGVSETVIRSVSLAGAGTGLRVKRKFKEARTDFLRVFLSGRNRTISVRRNQKLHLHGDFENDGRTHADGEGIVRRVERPLGSDGADDAFDRKRHNGRRRHEKKHVFVERDRRSRLALGARSVHIKDLDGNRDGRLNAGALFIRLAVYVEIGDRSLGREGASADERQRICRIFGHEVGKFQRIVFKLRLLDAGVEYLFRLNTYFFRQAVQRIARNGAGALIRLKIRIKRHFNLL